MPRVGSPLALLTVGLLTLALLSALVAAQSAPPAAEQAPVAKPKPKTKPQAKKAVPPADGEPAAAPKIDAAEAQRQIEAAQKSLDGGKLDLAVNQSNALMARPGLDSRAMARILAIRGQAHRKQAKPAQAISDLQAALELKGGLGESERATVMQIRSEAYKEAGLGEPKALAAGRPGVPGVTNVQTASTAKGPQTAPAPAAPSSGGFFSNLFGGGSAAAPLPKPASAPAAPVAPAAVAVPPPTNPAAAPRAATVTPAASSAAGPAAVLPKATPPVAAAASASGRFRLQLGAVRSRQEAQTLAEKIKSAHAGDIGDKRYEIDEAVFGNMGTFYRVRIGPFADADTSKAACTSLRAKGVDCMVIPQ